MELQKAVANKFNYFKRLIQLGETTIEALRESVYIRNGAIFGLDKKKREHDNDIDGLIARINKKEKEEQPTNTSVDLLIKEILGGFNKGERSAEYGRHPLEIIFGPVPSISANRPVNEEKSKELTELTKSSDEDIKTEDTKIEKKKYVRKPRRKKDSPSKNDN